MTSPNGRYQVEQWIKGGWALSEAYATYEDADTWAMTLLSAERGCRGAGVRVVDTLREQKAIDPVVWAVIG